MSNLGKKGDREHEQYLMGARNAYVDSFQDWKARIDKIDNMIRGEWPVPYPDGSVKTMEPLIMNLMDQMPRDVARLVAEASPTVNARPTSDTVEATANAVQREAVADGYWEANKGDILIPQLSMDLVVTGTAFLTTWFDSSSPYPKITRLDPRYCYPDVVNGQMMELLCIQNIKGRIARQMWPEADFMAEDKDTDEFWEIWTYYTPNEYTLAVAPISKAKGLPQENGIVILDHNEHGLGCNVASMVQLPSPDSGFRGLLDQLTTSMVTRNRIIEYLLEYSHHLVYAPWEQRGILNPDEEPGPTTRYDHNPDLQGETFMRRVQPAGPAPSLFSLLQGLEQEQRAQASYPASRQGEVPQDRASASFVASTQGTLTSVVRDVERLLADLREQTTYACAKVETAYLDFEKPLKRSAGGANTYIPSEVWLGNYDTEVIYGAGAGLDRQSTDVRLMQYYGNGIISQESVLENMDFIKDAPSEIERKQREEVSRSILQRFAGDPNISLDFIILVFELQQQEGLPLVDAITKAHGIQATQQAEAAEAEAAAPAGSIQEQADRVTAEELGEVPDEGVGGPAIAPISPFSPPPLPQTFTSNR